MSRLFIAPETEEEELNPTFTRELDRPDVGHAKRQKKKKQKEDSMGGDAWSYHPEDDVMLRVSILN